MDKWLKDSIAKLKKELSMEEWRVTIKKGSGNKKYVAEVKNDHAYKDMVITIFPSFENVWRKDKREALEDLCHEMVHSISDIVYDYAHDHVPESIKKTLTKKNEELTQRITFLLMKKIK